MINPLTNLRLQSQVKQLKEVSKQTAEFLSWLKDHADLPEVPGIGSSLINAIEHNQNMANYFADFETNLKQQLKQNKEKKPS
ncbi:hypothetical protein EC604_22435 [Paenibacillus amylolyticus]|uniref:Uncharacterized protein n=1 Tax=Paenibacillus amylolyticus TaxID=1451 RepID=A0A5M9WY44_PAEAM|nr:hypothetical protein [Paenibacillus amylolyticus]KAA8786590.1 hypothetical protein EC604_22435 [Paenibacillus amylolyticus]